MSNQDRLLSDEELREAIKRFCRTEQAADNLTAFINTQKHLYAESVIGEKGTRLSKLGNTLCDELIDEQRARIK